MIPNEISQKFLTFAKQKEARIIAIDGRCCSGKSTLATNLKEIFDCNVFHMDDFFLPKRMRTEGRLAQISGNIHYERFLDEIINPLKHRDHINYQKYRCSNDTFIDMLSMEPKKFNIVEGVYSMHPMFQSAYDYSIFLTVDTKKQLERVIFREGELKAKQFIEKWIPMEERYFSQLAVSSHCNITVDTTTT